jgi:hypothetical protein
MHVRHRLLEDAAIGRAPLGAMHGGRQAGGARKKSS